MMLKVFALFYILINTIYAFQRVNPRIVGGEDADISEAPYQVFLEMERHLCGGSIIGSKLILTAAHCVNGENDLATLNIRAGSTNKYVGGTILKPSFIMLHPNYDKDSHDFDIALVILKEDVLELCTNCKAIQLTNKGDPKNDENVTIFGWGLPQFNGSPVVTLRKVTVNVMNRKDCQTKMYFKNITKNMFCAYTFGKDTCQGDSGSPAVIDGMQAGIVSWGVGCATLEYPGMYTNIAEFIDWIEQYKYFA